ncbi:hypothetical protein PMKS-003848 [Pichia membranifaciens]|uniref:Uncharacterized protein n=1 Tax=Pichia membranifaciens TaxID=4926 RepID=A0A1Q2YLA0_9ASCO|nr:hypothetical protein PMKS-003848 [Pichia membranifaciens]
MPKNGQRAVKDLRLRRSRRAGSSETDSENRYGNFHRARGDEADEDDEKNDEELRTDGSGSGGQERGLENDDDDNEDNEDDEDDAEEENEHTDDSEGDIDDDLNSVFDSTSLSDFTEHPVPINFTYNYKPQQMMNLKMPTNVPAGEKSGRTISVINWTDVPLSQIAMKYNVSKSVIGPTLQVLRDFEKRNTKALQESIKRNRAASQEKKMLKESEEKSRVDEVENGKAKGENGREQGG